ncbi:MAG: hypothetical protein ABW275_05735 [Hansschlegelia sp.]
MRIDILAVVVGVLGAAWLSHGQAVAAERSPDLLKVAVSVAQAGPLDAADLTN